MVFLQFLKLYFLLFHEILHTDAKWLISKIWPSPIFENTILPAENAGNIPEKPVFLHFLEISSIVFFLIFYSKMQIRNVQNMAESDFW